LSAWAFTPKIYAQWTGNEAIVSIGSLGFGDWVVAKNRGLITVLEDRVQVFGVRPELEPYGYWFVCAEKRV